MEKARIRLGTEKDIGAISETIAESWKSSYRGIIDDGFLDELSDDAWVLMLSEGMKNDSLYTMLLEERGKTIGASILKRTEAPDKIELTSFYLLPDKIGKGYGRAFYSAIESEVKKRGYKACVLDVLEDNKRAIRFYLEQGFENERKTLKALLGDKEYCCKIMTKQLS